MNVFGRRLRMIRIRNTLSRLFRTRRKRKLRVLFSFEVEVEGREKPIKIQVVEDQPCPYCGAIFPNRPKVHNEIRLVVEMLHGGLPSRILSA
jgi:hypothetical protein